MTASSNKGGAQFQHEGKEVKRRQVVMSDSTTV